MTTRIVKSFSAASKRKETAKPFCIRLKPSEIATLKERAAPLTVSAYIRRCTLGDSAAPRRAVRRIKSDHTIAARLLAALGQSRLSANLNQIAKAAHLGTLPVDDELMAELAQACADIRAMRRELVAALGIKPSD